MLTVVSSEKNSGVEGFNIAIDTNILSCHSVWFGQLTCILNKDEDTHTLS